MKEKLLDLPSAQRKGYSGTALLWVRSRCSYFQRLPISVLGEICLYFDWRRIVDIIDDRLFVFGVERQQWRYSTISVKEKGRPSLLVWHESIYLFCCGKSGILYTGNSTYHMDFGGSVQQLADSPCKGLLRPGLLYDSVDHYIYLFGGCLKSKKSTTIRVYDPKGDKWTCIQATMLLARSHFSALEYMRKALLAGGCDAVCIEIFSLETGESCLGYQGFPANLLQEHALLWNGTLIGMFSECLILLHLHQTKEYSTRRFTFSNWKTMPKENASIPKKLVVFDGGLYFIIAPYTGFFELIR